MNSASRFLRLATAPLILAAGATALCYTVAGDSLGFWLGPVALCALIVPPLAAGERDRLRAIVLSGAVTDGIAVMWLIAAALLSRATLLQWLMCYLVLLAFAWALCGITRLLRSGAIVTIISLAWLT